jgi:hypothetical protein
LTSLLGIELTNFENTGLNRGPNKDSNQQTLLAPLLGTNSFIAAMRNRADSTENQRENLFSCSRSIGAGCYNSRVAGVFFGVIFCGRGQGYAA